MLSRRQLLSTVAVLAVGGVGYKMFERGSGEMAEGEAGTNYEFARTDSQWREILTPKEFAVLRREGTERPNTSALLAEKRAGTFQCGACELPVYRSETKYESGTGWPSFWAAMDDAVLTKTDYKSLFPRTEVHCRRCGSHFGHIFNDGPKPTGMRHCLNGVALTFVMDV